MRARTALLVLVGPVLVLGGCASAAQPEVEKVAAVFEEPGTDPQFRCDLLAPATRESLESSGPCTEAVRQLPTTSGAVHAVQVWGRDAQAKVGSDTVFLTRTDSGWKVSAALCRPRGDAPYDCQVQP
jgi:hypothetical protein